MKFSIYLNRRVFVMVCLRRWLHMWRLFCHCSAIRKKFKDTTRFSCYKKANNKIMLALAAIRKQQDTISISCYKKTNNKILLALAAIRKQITRYC